MLKYKVTFEVNNSFEPAYDAYTPESLQRAIESGFPFKLGVNGKNEHLNIVNLKVTRMRPIPTPLGGPKSKAKAKKGRKRA